MKQKALFFIMICASIFAINSYAEALPKGLSVDHRIKIVTYNPDNVTLLKIHYGYSTDIMFDKNEIVQNVAIGDSLAWQATPVKNHLFIKPVALSNTNMTVLTNFRHYNFQLVSANDANPYNQIYELKFIYPAENNPFNTIQAAPEQCTPTQCNWKYSFTGDKSIAPIQVFDDGKFTYFKFRANGSSRMPAVYVVDKNRHESLVNYHLQQGYVVVNQVAPQFTLRSGDYVTCIYNDDAIGDWASIK